MRHVITRKSTPNPVECYSWIGVIPIKNPINSIRQELQLIQRPETILKVRQNVTFLEVIKRSLVTSFSLTLLTTERRLTGR